MVKHHAVCPCPSSTLVALCQQYVPSVLVGIWATWRFPKPLGYPQIIRFCRIVHCNSSIWGTTMLGNLHDSNPCVFFWPKLGPRLFGENKSRHSHWACPYEISTGTSGWEMSMPTWHVVYTCVGTEQICFGSWRRNLKAGFGALVIFLPRSWTVLNRDS